MVNQTVLNYMVKLHDAIASCFNEDNDNYIDINELEDEENATAFMHALANVMPCHLMKKITGENWDILQFNHNANRLIFQFAKVTAEEDEATN